MVVLHNISNGSSRCSTPAGVVPVNPLNQLAGFGHHNRIGSTGRRLSISTLEQFAPLREDRKISLQSVLQKTKDGLANPFGCDEQTPEDLIYNLFKIPNKSDASVGKLIMVLKNYGLQENDPRLAPMMRKIREIESEKEERMNEARDPKHWKMSQNDFKRVISESLSLIVQTLQNDLVVPAWGHFCSIIREIYNECLPINGGKVADYIPQLARISPDNWGVSICTVDGQRVSFGNSNVPFCVQSVSKAFNYSIAASELGPEYVHQYVGQEPSGRLFNEICLDFNNKPHNPMVNSGAIIVSSLIRNQLNMADRFEYMINEYRKLAGGEYVGFNNAVFLSEAATADRNFALAYFMKENGCFPPESKSTNLKEVLDFYFQLCSLEVTCGGAAVMAATLANGGGQIPEGEYHTKLGNFFGVCPLTGERCIGSRQCRDVLSLMNSCGMYDYSGQFSFHVGLPAKSGVSGVMIVVVPNLMGIALWSPPLDRMGNSCRGVEFCKKLIQRFNFHNYDSLAHNESLKFDPRRRVGEREKAAVVSLLFAAKAGDLNTIRRMYMQGCDLEMADYDKRTALHLAASEGHFDVTLFLLETGRVQPDPRDRWNRTPLDDARSARHTSVALLLERRMQELQAPPIDLPQAKPLHTRTLSLQGLSAGRDRSKALDGSRSSITAVDLPNQSKPEENKAAELLHGSKSLDISPEAAQPMVQQAKRAIGPSPLSHTSFTSHLLRNHHRRSSDSDLGCADENSVTDTEGQNFRDTIYHQNAQQPNKKNGDKGSDHHHQNGAQNRGGSDCGEARMDEHNGQSGQWANSPKYGQNGGQIKVPDDEIIGYYHDAQDEERKIPEPEKLNGQVSDDCEHHFWEEERRRTLEQEQYREDSESEAEEENILTDSNEVREISGAQIANGHQQNMNVEENGAKQQRRHLNSFTSC